MTDVIVTVSGSLGSVPTELRIQVAGGPFSISWSPSAGVDLTSIWNGLSDELTSLIGIGLPDITTGLWADLLQIKAGTTVMPTLFLTASKDKSAKFSLSLELAFSNPIVIGGHAGSGGFSVTLEPNVSIWAFYVTYTQGEGIDLRAKISTPTTAVPGALTSGTTPPDKTQIVSYPFPVPAQGSVGAFQLKYLGLGQRVGPTAVVTGSDPMATIFNQLETQLTGDDPASILTTLAQTFYQPERGWFVAADIAFRGWEVRILFNDPAMYGLEITAATGPFAGFLFEILYQKLSPNLGVYFGALTLPMFMRRIVLDGVILILPGFSIWVYTNGDFRINVGWPLGSNSIGVQVGPLNGIGGFYFAKLRSADNPGAQAGPNYDLILEFGIGISVFIQESFSASIFSASISVTVTATLQGLLAWGTGGITSGPPDHYWFAGTASIVVLLQGSVDFAILKASVSVSLSAVASVAFETGYQTIIAVSANVSVEVSVHIVFFTIHLSFNTTVSTSFTIGGGIGPASPNGPLAPGLSAFGGSADLVTLHASALEAVQRMLRRRTPLALRGVAPHVRRGAVSPPTVIDVYFCLQPTVVYGNGTSAIALVASLCAAAPAPASRTDQTTDFSQLVIAIVEWLVADYSTVGDTWCERLEQVSAALGTGSEPPGPAFGSLAGFACAFKTFLKDSVVFQVHDVNDVDNGSPNPLANAAVLPMFEELELSYVGASGPQTIAFDTFDRTPADYPEILQQYFNDLHWTGPQRDAMAAGVRDAGSPDTGPSVASYLFYDYYLMEARNAISVLQQTASAAGTQAQRAYLEHVESLSHSGHASWGLVDAVTAHVEYLTIDMITDLFENFDFASAAGMGSRYLLHGLQLPVPTPELMLSSFLSSDLTAVATSGVYELTGQQYAAVVGALEATATLAVNPLHLADASWLACGSGSPGVVSTTTALPATVPAEPDPVWMDTPGPSGPGALAITSLPAVAPAPLYFGAKSQIAWTAGSDTRTLLPLPQAITSLVSTVNGLQVALSTEPPAGTLGPPAGTSPDVSVPAISVLLIRLTLSQVSVSTNANVGPVTSPSGVGSPGGAAVSRYLPFVYQISGTDEATREQIHAALSDPHMPPATISLCYTPAGSGKLQSEALSPDVLLAKTNLSTLNQVVSAGPQFLMQLHALTDAPVDWTPITDVKKSLRLLWEASVVNAPGFFLYYRTADEQDLPSDLFSDAGGQGGESIEFDIVVQFGQTPEQTVPVAPYCSAVLMEGAPPTGGSLFAAVLDGNGNAVPTYAPTYPAGSIGFNASWNVITDPVAPPLIPVHSLYQLIQFSVIASNGYTGSIWSLPVGPAGTASAGGGSTGSPPAWQYQQTLPIYRFAGGSPTGDRYGAIGQPAELGFRLIDLYGNALTDTHTATFAVLYQDPLIGITQWLGTFTNYYFDRGSNGDATLIVSLRFDPDAIVPAGGFAPTSPETSGTTSLAQWQAAAEQYALVLAQLSDPNVALRIHTSLSASVVDDGTTLRPSLQTFVGEVLAQISVAIAEGSPPDPHRPAPAPVLKSLDFSIPLSDVAALSVDILPITVDVEFARPPALVFPEALSAMPTAGRISVPLQPKQDLEDITSPPGSPPSGGGVTTFAMYCERAFAGFDGQDGMLKVAQRTSILSGDQGSTVAGLWATRWSASAGMAVVLNDAGIVYFALRPLSTSLLTCEVNGITYASVDVDGWASTFLSAFDAFLSPATSVGIGVLDQRNGTTSLTDLLTLKQRLAKAIPSGVAALLAKQVGDGDIGAAQDQLEQALLTELASAYSISTIMQVPAWVTIVGSAEGSASPATPPQLYGALTPPASGSPQTSASPVVPKQFTISAAELALEKDRRWITTMVSVAQARAQAELELSLQYEVSYLQHLFETSESFQGYTPSSWLKFVLPGDATLSMPITRDGDVQIPIPLMQYPEAPLMVIQSAYGATLSSPSTSSPWTITQEIADALKWTYEATVGHTWAAQDQMYVDVTFNLTAQVQRSLARSTADNISPLLSALAVFLQMYPTIAPLIPDITRDAFNGGSPSGSPGIAEDVIAQFLDGATNVTTAWEQVWAPPRAMAFKSAVVIIDHYYLMRDVENEGVVNLYARTDTGANPHYWPELVTADGQSWQPDGTRAKSVQQDDKVWWFLPHTFAHEPNFDTLVFRWTPLDVLERQTASTSAWIVRNANLVADRNVLTNSAFVYSTQAMQFASPAVPLITRGELQPLAPSTSLEATLEQIFEPIVGVGQDLDPLLRVEVSYSFAIVPGSSGPPLRTTIAILLADDINLGSSGSPLTQVATSLAAEIGKWWRQVQPSNASALLNLNLSLFGYSQGERLPLIEIQQIPIEVDNVQATWWTGSINAT